MDEGGLPTFLDSPDRSYIPGKPHPNCFEYFGLGDQFMMHILWDKPHIDQKYARPKEMKALVLKFAEFLERYKDDWTGRIPPFHLYLDSRFSSLELMKDLKQMGLYATMSLSVSASPQGLYNWLRTVSQTISIKLQHDHLTACLAFTALKDLIKIPSGSRANSEKVPVLTRFFRRSMSHQPRRMHSTFQPLS